MTELLALSYSRIHKVLQKSISTQNSLYYCTGSTKQKITNSASTEIFNQALKNPGWRFRVLFCALLLLTSNIGHIPFLSHQAGAQFTSHLSQVCLCSYLFSYPLITSGRLRLCVNLFAVMFSLKLLLLVFIDFLGYSHNFCTVCLKEACNSALIRLQKMVPQTHDQSKGGISDGHHYNQRLAAQNSILQCANFLQAENYGQLSSISFFFYNPIIQQLVCFIFQECSSKSSASVRLFSSLSFFQVIARGQNSYFNILSEK